MKYIFYISCLSLIILTCWSCNKPDEDKDDPTNKTATTFNKSTKCYVNYELGSEKHDYKQGNSYYLSHGHSGSVGIANSNFDYDFGLINRFEEYYFYIEMGTVGSPSNIMYDANFWNFFNPVAYQYQRDTVKPWVSMAFVDKNGELWYTDSADNSSATFNITDTIGYYDTDEWSTTEKIKAEFSCQAAQRKGGKVQKITNGELVATFQSY